MRRMRDERVRQTNEKARIRRRRRWIDASYGRASWNRYNDCIMMELRFWSLRQRCSSEFIHARQNISWLRRAPAVFVGLCTGDIVLAKIVRLSTLPPFTVLSPLLPCTPRHRRESTGRHTLQIFIHLSYPFVRWQTFAWSTNVRRLDDLPKERCIGISHPSGKR